MWWGIIVGVVSIIGMIFLDVCAFLNYRLERQNQYDIYVRGYKRGFEDGRLTHQHEDKGE